MTGSEHTPQNAKPVLDEARQRLKKSLDKLEQAFESRLRYAQKEAEELGRAQVMKQLGESRSRSDSLTKEVAQLREKDALHQQKVTALEDQIKALEGKLKQQELINRTLEARNTQARARLDTLMGRLQKYLMDEVANTSIAPASRNNKESA